MPSSVNDLLAAAGLTWHSVSRWGTIPPLDTPGLYLVSTSADPNDNTGPSSCELSAARLAELVRVRPEVSVAGVPGNVETVASALTAMWPAGEPVVYIGLASESVSDRVRRYYSTPIGARAPHAGGWPIKMLANLDQLHVHVAPAANPDVAETTALMAFMDAVGPDARQMLCDPALPLPFANLELTKGMRKRHGIRGAKEKRSRSNTLVLSETRTASGRAGRPQAVASGASFTLNVTAADIDAGQIRVTRPPKHRLGLPRVKTTVSLTLRGVPMTVPWDPRLGPAQERSGLLRIGREATRNLLGSPVSLVIERDADGVLALS